MYFQRPMIDFASILRVLHARIEMWRSRETSMDLALRRDVTA
jgi:hypothetical protein